jgi:hypothetical protein
MATQTNWRTFRSASSVFICLGMARLPRTGAVIDVLLVEMQLDAATGRVVDIESNLPLAGFQRVLRACVRGAHISDLPAAMDSLDQQYLSPYKAAIRAAVASAARTFRAARQETAASTEAPIT